MISKYKIRYKNYEGTLEELRYMSPGTGYRLVINENGAIVTLSCVSIDDIEFLSEENTDLPF